MNSRVMEMIVLLSSTLAALDNGSNCDASVNPSDPFVSKLSSEAAAAQATTSYCLTGGNNCLVVKLCNNTVKLFNTDVSAPKALCAENTLTANVNFFQLPFIRISFERSKIEEPRNGKCDCNTCDQSCSPQDTTVKSATGSKFRELTNTSIGRQSHQTDTDDDGDNENEELPEVSVSTLFYDVGLRANSCLSQSLGHNYSTITACNNELMGIFSGSDLPALCYGGYANVSSVLSLSDPHSALLLHLSPIKSFPLTNGECGCNLCDGFCGSR